MNLKLITLFAIAAKYSSAQQCRDSELTFKYYGNEKKCIKVATNTTLWCARSGKIMGNVTTHCPVSCDSCDSRQDSNMRFLVNITRVTGEGEVVSKGLKWKRCHQWAGLKNSLAPVPKCGRCLKKFVKITCPITCEPCPWPM
mmetsp:Transcript_23422/g.27655  ORF Transcript_23422/g.27655 Transcript_23422/m.27655 type:complete len:142 (+) Transcript_23422:62-487(+)